MKKIEWTKMHAHNYDGTCRVCGGKCQDAESIASWNEFSRQLAEIERVNNYGGTDEEKAYWNRREKYLKRQAEKYGLYTFKME